METAATRAGAADQTIVAVALAAHLVVQIRFAVRVVVGIVHRVRIVGNHGLGDMLPFAAGSLDFLKHMLRLRAVLLAELLGHDGHLLQGGVEDLVPLRNILAGELLLDRLLAHRHELLDIRSLRLLVLRGATIFQSFQNRFARVLSVNLLPEQGIVDIQLGVRLRRHEACLVKQRRHRALIVRDHTRLLL